MQAIVKDGAQLSLREVPRPAPQAGAVLVRVEAAALCRTDLYVARGQLNSLYGAPIKQPLILGHEAAGRIAAVGSDTVRTAVGDRVALMPLMPCGRCRECRTRQYSVCQRQQMLGVHLDGAFAEYILVPESVVHPIPDQLSFVEAAYCEPIAAVLGLLKSGIDPQFRGLILGGGRIAELVKRVLEFGGCCALETATEGEEPPESEYDFVVETALRSATPGSPLTQALRAIKPRGRVLLRSRAFTAAPLDVLTVVQKEVHLQGIGYGSFTQAIELAASGHLELADLCSPPRPFAEFEAVFRRAEQSESLKQFFGSGDVRRS